jgi:beta-barrel assembly-enhancing protease
VRGFPAELYDGQSALARPVLVTVELAGLRLRAADGTDELGFWPSQGLDLESLGGGQLHVRHPAAPGALLSSGDAELAVAVAALGHPLRGLPRGRRLLRLGLMLGGAIVGLVALIYLSLPALSRSLARRVPLDVESRLGFQIESLMERRYCQSAPATAALDDLLARLSLPAAEGPSATKVRVLDWDLTNAFTLPGGTVVLTRGLIDKAAGPDEIAGVLAHELEHVRQRHVMAQLIRSSILSLGWAVTVGDFSGLMVVDPGTAFAIANQRFSRDDERDADAGALQRLDRARIDRAGFAAFFRRLQADSADVPAWLSTHPASEERVQAIGTTRVSGCSPALTDAAWIALRAACADRPEVTR